ncbi:hypothetical protein BEWA_047120 [Theileria equi strain WA]|uniref:Uncharacterized protein n=1 Tax=Theileria equi strain WA TaxID=1537102 RepID=L1LAU6_THEEQ|nr:hypothetical protein BEWA_047120 [Theileria equi strain WA]EKX72248.1 hypothetical protein BEWA_047120 [Theileria equi strain WA]|eukprot:XP_004831700.1 hypothetical protein BEWA_047120 [Theileria equi strain WA]
MRRCSEIGYLNPQPVVTIDLGIKTGYICQKGSFGICIVCQSDIIDPGIVEYAHYPYPRTSLGFTVREFIYEKKTNLPTNLENVESVLVYFEKSRKHPLLLKIVLCNMGLYNTDFGRYYYIRNPDGEWMGYVYTNDIVSSTERSRLLGYILRHPKNSLETYKPTIGGPMVRIDGNSWNAHGNVHVSSRSKNVSKYDESRQAALGNAKRSKCGQEEGTCKIQPKTTCKIKS